MRVENTLQENRVTLGILAGGRATRLGGRDKAWLQKIRPYWGHDAHFHVRLKCPKGASFCQTQTPTVAELSNGGSGCDESLNWWVTDALDPSKQQPADPDAPKQKGARDYTMADLPGQCASVLSAR